MGVVHRWLRAPDGLRLQPLSFAGGLAVAALVLTWTRATVSETGGSEDRPGDRDVISVEVALPHLATIRLTKTQEGNYLANGVPGWGLMVGAHFTELLETLGDVTGETRQAG